MSFLAPHPRDWRTPIMDDHDRRGCCLPDHDDREEGVASPSEILHGHECSVCGWIDDHDNEPELHQIHLAHILAGGRQQAHRTTHFANTGRHLDEE